MVKVRSVAWHHEAWEICFEIREGVYRLDNYPVRITHLGQSDNDDLKEDLAVIATGLLRRHMRRGALPPHAMVTNWSRVVRLSQGSEPAVRAAIERLTDGHRDVMARVISSHF